jgi:putative transposase
LNALLNAEADRLCNAQQLRAQRRSSGQAGLSLRTQGADQGRPGQAADAQASGADVRDDERYRRRESSVEEALIEMYLAGVSVRQVEDISEALWHASVAIDGIGAEQETLRNDRGMA